MREYSRCLRPWPASASCKQPFCWLVQCHQVPTPECLAEVMHALCCIWVRSGSSDEYLIACCHSCHISCRESESRATAGTADPLAVHHLLDGLRQRPSDWPSFAAAREQASCMSRRAFAALPLQHWLQQYSVQAAGYVPCCSPAGQIISDVFFQNALPPLLTPCSGLSSQPCKSRVFA